MLKISAHIAKKVPLPNEKFSSQQFGASLELEVSDGAKPEEIQDKIRRLYAVISRSIDEQIAGANGKTGAIPVPSNGALRQNPPNGLANGNGNGSRFVPSTAAQQNAIKALCRKNNLELANILRDAQVANIEGLSIRAASSMIDKLKGNPAAVNGNGGQS
jgi:hypothetical protein